MLLDSWPIFGLLGTVFGSIFEVALLCIAGYVLARNGILDKKTQKHINRINVSLFTPALLFSKVAFSLTREKLRELWIIPIVFIVTTACSMLVAYLFGSVLRLKKSQKSFAMAAAMFMNSNSLPVALMQSMVYSIKLLKWGDDDTEDAMLGRALTYLVLYSTFGMVLRWSYGVHLLSQADEEEPTKQHDPEQPTESSSLLHHAGQTQTYASIRGHSSPATTHSHTKDALLHHKRTDSDLSNSSSSNSSTPTIPAARKQDAPSVTVAESTSGSPSPLLENGEHHHGLLHPSSLLHKHSSPSLDPRAPPVQPTRKPTKPKFFQSFPSTPMYPRSASSSSSSSSSSSDNGEDMPENDHLPSSLQEKKPPYSSVFHAVRHGFHKVNAFITAPTWAAMLSLIVACTPALQHFMAEHVQPVKKALNAAGACSIPLTMIVLGAYFFVEPVEEKKREEEGALDRLKNLVGTKRSKNASNSSLVKSIKSMLEGDGKGKTNHHHGVKDWLPQHHRGMRERVEDVFHPHHHGGIGERIETAIHPRHYHHPHMPELPHLSRSPSPSPPQPTHTYTSLSDILHPHNSFTSRPGETRTVIVAVLSRMILTPLVLLPLLTLLLASGVTEVFSDPVFVVTNVLLITSAPALTLAQITQAACGDAFERLISRTIFWSYCVVTPPATVVSVVIGLWLTKL